MSADKQLTYWLGFWIALLIVSITLVQFVPFPFVFVLLLWLGGLIFAARQSQTSIKRAICINIAAVVGLFLVLEAHWINKKEFRHAPVVETQHAKGTRMKDPILGHRRAPNYSKRSTKTIDGQTSYSVTYTTDSSGYRVTPEPVNPADDTCLIFLGCSFTFGDGVDDEDSMPWQVAKISNRRSFNLGVSGYGPHHMLAAVEFDLLPDLQDCSRKVAVYQAIEDHVSRAAGVGSLGRVGPRYVISDTGEVVYAGQFDEVSRETNTNTFWAGLFGKSYIYREYFVDRMWVGDDEVELYLAIVAKAKARLKQKFPELRFVVLYWDNSTRSHAVALDERLPAIADEYIRVSDIIPDIQTNKAEWLLYLDPHPNAKAHKALAEYLATRVTP